MPVILQPPPPAPSRRGSTNSTCEIYYANMRKLAIGIKILSIILIQLYNTQLVVDCI
jgi:hypothetical protein